MTENNKQIKFQVERIKITSKKRGASKFFKAMYFIPAVIAGTVGAASVIGSSVVSGLGLFEQDKVVKKVNAVVTDFENRFTTFTTNLKTNLTNTLKGVTTNVSSKNVDAIMNDVIYTFFKVFKLPLSTITQAAIYQNVSTTADGSKNVETFITSLVDTFITTNKPKIKEGVQATVANIIYDLYGEKLANGEYSKMQTWKIVFGVTTTVASIMVISAIGYWISRIDDHRKAKKNINILKKIAAAADDKNVEYIIAKINNRYSID